MRFYACCFRSAQICFNESDYVTLHSIMNIMTESGTKMTHKCHNNGFKLLLSGNCQKGVVTSTPWQML